MAVPDDVGLGAGVGHGHRVGDRPGERGGAGVAGPVGGRDGDRVGAGRGRRARMAPVEALIDSPAGRPVADQVSGGREDESVAERSTAVMAVPDTSDWLAGLVDATVLVTVQVNVAEPG